MTGPFNPLLAGVAPPPIAAARAWLDAAPPDLPLIDVSQAAPAAPPPEALRRALAGMIVSDDALHLYGPILGLPDLRAALADRWSRLYDGAVGPGQIAITAGCNQAFAAALATLAAPGDDVILPVPWYFNHTMWCEMSSVAVRPLRVGADMLPDPAAAADLIGERTRAIALVSPNNPAGVEYPAPLLRAFLDLARSRGIALILDETYRDFHAQPGAPHDLFGDPAWDGTLIQLYSFSKAYRLTGHRVGAIAASPARMSQVEKFLDTVAICPAQPGQHAALWGIRHLDEWLAGERAEVLSRRDALTKAIASLPGWGVSGCGAYFAYVSHPWGAPSGAVAPWLVARTGVLALPGTMFAPPGDAHAARHLRIAFANVDRDGISGLCRRLAGLRDLAPAGPPA